MKGLLFKSHVPALSVLIAAAIALAACAPAASPAHTSTTPAGGEAATASSAAFELRTAMRQLWEDHIVWTRQFIVSFVAGLPDQDAAAARLLQNQVDIGDAIKPYYGEEAGDRLTELLRAHILTAVDLLTAAKSGDTAKFDEANEAWYANADEIAAFLSSANPESWPAEEMQSMMRSHLDLTLQEAVARLGGDWSADVTAYDSIHQQILEMADMLADGVVRQFPDRFE